jgi:Fe-S cluster biosynthesis and repair protein YggX
MTNTVHCNKLNKDAEALDFAPYPGELGQKILANISKEAWQQWLTHQTMLINENRLNMLDPESRKFLATEMEKFLFGGGSDKPAGYVPPEDKDA